MAVAAARPRRSPISTVATRDFSGGWNQRDAPTELAPNESPDMWNFTLDERGGASKRLGMVKYNSPAFPGGMVKQLWSWKTAGRVLSQCGASIYRDTSTVAAKTFSTDARVGFAEFLDKAYVIHPVDGMFSTTDGLTWSAVAGAPKGSVVVPWQSRLLALGDPDHPTRLYACKIADPTNWGTGPNEGWTNDIVEINSKPLLAAEGGSGVDIQGRPGLVLFKETSTYRMYDSATGAYQTIDSTTGAASALAVESLFGRIFVLNTKGIFVTDGIGTLKEVSEKITPLFVASQIALDRPELFCAGQREDRLVFSLPRYGSTANDLELEYHPAQGWIAPHSSAASCYATHEEDTRKLLSGSPTVAGQVYERDRTGSDDGTAIPCRLQTRWIEPTPGYKCNFRHVRIYGRGIFDLYVKRNFSQALGVPEPIRLAGGAAVWDESVWDGGTALWGPVNFEDSQDFWSLGEGLSIAFEIREESTVSAIAPRILETGPFPEVGACALYALFLEYTTTHS